MEEIFAALGRTTVFVSIGTSGVVYPAAAFVQSVRARCGKTVYIGLEAPENLPLFAERYLGKAGELVPRLLAISDL
jgi:NAD-dependent deacetylase